MKKTYTKTASRRQNLAEILRSWTLLVLSLLFVLLYAAALFGWLRPLADTTLLSRLEPIIFLVFGYYFGRSPSRQSEKIFAAEIRRQKQTAEAAQHSKERAQLRQEIIEEKLKNAKTALRSDSSEILRSVLPENGGHMRMLANGASNRSAIGTALKILDS